MNRIEIPINKTKTFFAVTFTIIMTLLAVYFFINAEEHAKSSIFIFFQSPLFNKLMAILGFMLFGFLTIYGIKKIKSNKMGLVIDDNEIIDNSGVTSIGVIKWSDIVEFKTESYAGSKFLLVFVKNPNQYIENLKGFKQKMIQGNMDTHGTPISISSNMLKYNFNDLEKLLQQRLIEYKNKNSPDSI